MKRDEEAGGNLSGRKVSGEPRRERFPCGISDSASLGPPSKDFGYCAILLILLVLVGSAEGAEPTVPALSDRVAELIATLRDGAPKERVRAAERLRNLGKAAVEYLLPALEDESPAVRRGVLHALRGIGDRKALPAILPLTKDKDPTVRTAAVEALGSLGTEEEIGLLTALLKDPEPSVRAAAIAALGRLAAERALPSIEPLLADVDAAVRGTAAFALGLYGSRDSVTLLIKALSDPNEKVRMLSNLSLIRLTGRDVGFDAAAAEADRAKSIQSWVIWWETAAAK